MSALNALLVGYCFLAVYPFLVMIFGSLKSQGEFSTNPGGFPAHPTTGAYDYIGSGFRGSLLWRSLLNSFIVAIPYTLLTVVLAAMAGYAFAKYSFRGKNVIFALLIASMLIPLEVNIPTLYVLFSHIGWLNTYQVQIFPGLGSGIGVLCMFMARQYMRGLPDEVLEAASVDGAGHWRRFWRIAMPMSLPILGAVAVFAFVFKWSDYLWPLVMVTNTTYQPIMVTLPELGTAPNGFIILYEVLLAGCVIVTVPALLLFGRFQNVLMRGTIAGAVRG